MELIDDFKTKYPKLWSVRFHVLAAIASILETINTLGTYLLPAMQDYVRPGVFAVVAVIFTVAGLIARGIKQFWPETDSENS